MVEANDANEGEISREGIVRQRSIYLNPCWSLAPEAGRDDLCLSVSTPRGDVGSIRSIIKTKIRQKRADFSST